jgi:hypothetical protein
MTSAGSEATAIIRDRLRDNLKEFGVGLGRPDG